MKGKILWTMLLAAGAIGVAAVTGAVRQSGGDEPKAEPEEDLSHVHSDQSRPIITKQYRTVFKGLTLGESKFDQARMRADVIDGASRVGDNPLLKPDLWLGDAALLFDRASGALEFVHIHDVGFADVNGIKVGGPWADVSRLAGKALRDHYIDETNGVVYWDDDGVGTVTKIVYASHLRVRAS